MSNLSNKFSRAADKAVCRTIGLSSGEAGTGKTSFWLTAPGPLLVQSLDKGLEGVVERFAKAQDKEIYTIDYDWSPGAEDFTQDHAITLRDRLIGDYTYALDNGIRTILWDKENDIWEMFRYAEFGGPSEKPKDYAKLNQRYIALINKSKAHPVNFGLIQGMKDEWGLNAKGSPTNTGRRIRTGFGRLDELVFVELHHVRKDGQFTIEVGKCRQNTQLQDQTFSLSGGGADFADFAGLGQLLITDSKPGDWK